MPGLDCMTLGDILSKEQIIPDLKAANRWEAIDELLGHLVQCGKIKPEHRDQIAAVVKKRETSMSTGIGFGIGIPHASTDQIQEVTGAFGRSKAGVNFDFSRFAMNFSKSSTVTRPAAPVPAMPAKSAACRPSSFIRAFIRGEM